jgi:hypothetical protein
MMILAFGTTAPLGSVIVPRISPVVTCAKAAQPKSKSAKNADRTVIPVPPRSFSQHFSISGLHMNIKNSADPVNAKLERMSVVLCNSPTRLRSL